MLSTICRMEQSGQTAVEMGGVLRTSAYLVGETLA